MTRSDAALVQSAARFDRVRRDSAWSLLRANQAPIVLAVLHANFVESGEARVPATVLFERIGDDLEALRVAGHELPQSPQRYVADWLDAGYLERRTGSAGTSGAGSGAGSSAAETYELSADALAALRIATEIVTPPRSVTESRLTTVMGQLEQLAIDTDTDVASRLESLTRERERLDHRISNIREGRIDVVAPDAALERIRDILLLAEQLPADFARVRRDVESLNVQFRRDIIESDGARGEVLDALFRGVDVLQDNEAGRSFGAFYALLINPERSAGLDRSIDDVLTRDALGSLKPAERIALRTLVERLTSRGGEVHEVYASLARSLRTFVQQREYVEERRVSRLLKQAQRAFGELSGDGSLIRPTGFTLSLSKAQLGSVSQFTMTAPDTERPPGLVDNPPVELDLDRVRELINESDINLYELRRNVDATLEDLPVASISDVLDRYPATQGLGSLIGLLSIGLERTVNGRAVLVENERDLVAWGDSGLAARVPTILFTQSSEEHP
ncbi:DUF3375 domain-containing protein [Marisediminicola antarctica]